MLVSGFSPGIAWIVWNASFCRLGRITWPRQSMVSAKKLHLFSLRVAYALFRIEKNYRACLMCCSGVSMRSLMSSGLTSSNGQFKLAWMTSIVRWKFQGALRSPKGKLVDRYSPWCKVKVVLSMSISSILICQHPLSAPGVDKLRASPSKPILSSIREIEYGFRFGTVLSLRKLAQSWRVPSFLGTSTMGAAHSVCAGQ